MILALQSCHTRDDLAHLLGYKPKTLSYILYQIPDSSKYTSFTIKKKDGSDRIIHAPVPKLRALQSKLSNLLYECITQISSSGKNPYGSATAYAKGSSIAANAKRHARRRFVFNIDLEDFFPSIHIGRIMGYLVKDKHFSLQPDVARTIGQIACHEGSLPQGSPCSPVISNLIASLLDARLARFAGKHGCRYSRYADDITFSTNKLEFPGAIAIPDDSPQGWVIAEDLASRIASAGYTPKASKTRMSVRASRQVVTGLIVNSKVNVPEEFYRRTRAMCHRVFRGEDPYQHRFYDEDPADQDVPASLAHIEGRLAHLYWIKSQSDSRDWKRQQDKPANYFKLYRDFLLFKTFYRSPKPLVITEGESDRVYVRLSSMALFSGDPDFSVDDSGKKRPSYRTLAYSKRLAKVVGLAGGTGNLIKTLVQLKDFARRHHGLIPTSPVVIIIDNDAGAKSLLNTVKDLFGATASPANSEDFLRLATGWYLVRTPPRGKQNKTFIESFLPSSVLKQQVGGKTFSAEATFDTAKHFGKVRLAQIVATNAPNVNLKGYAPLLERIRAAWNDWKSATP